MIAVYLAAVHRRRPSRREVVSIVLAMLGTVLLVTHGEMGVLQISLEALLWGLSSALALAFYTVQPVALLKRHDSAVVVGWGMLIGGLAFVGWSQPWHMFGTWDSGTYGAVLFIVVLGTLVPFYCYLLAVKTTREARNGQIVVARVGEEVTVKRFQKTARGISLLPENPDFSPIEVHAGDVFSIEGLAVGLIRNQF